MQDDGQAPVPVHSMRLFAVLVLLSFTAAEYWVSSYQIENKKRQTVHINAKLKCNGKAVKERLHYEITDTNYTRFDRC